MPLRVYTTVPRCNHGSIHSRRMLTARPRQTTGVLRHNGDSVWGGQGFDPKWLGGIIGVELRRPLSLT